MKRSSKRLTARVRQTLLMEQVAAVTQLILVRDISTIIVFHRKGVALNLSRFVVALAVVR
jgi:hypothetical protein